MRPDLEIHAADTLMPCSADFEADMFTIFSVGACLRHNSTDC